MELGEWLDTWLKLYVDPSALAKSTKACYHRAVAAVPDKLRGKNLCELNALDILPWVQLVASHHPRAAQLDLVMLGKALRIASKVGLCRPGIIDPETTPKPVYTPSKAVILQIDDLRRYMAAAAGTECAPVLMLCCCGLRRSEARGVCWDAVDLVSGILTIRGQRRGNELRPLKTSHSLRQLQLPEIVTDTLRHWPHALATPWVCDVSEQRVYAAHHRIIRRLQLPAVTLHGLRHSFATAAVMQGVPVKLLQCALGHGHFAITADLYADHLPSVSAVPTRVYA